MSNIKKLYFANSFYIYKLFVFHNYYYNYWLQILF